MTKLIPRHPMFAVCFGEYSSSDSEWMLTEAGRSQAGEAAHRLLLELQDVPFRIMSANLPVAAIQTAQLIAGYLGREPSKEELKVFDRAIHSRGWLSGGYEYGSANLIAEVNRYWPEMEADEREVLVLVMHRGDISKLQSELGSQPQPVVRGSVWQIISPDLRVGLEPLLQKA